MKVRQFGKLHINVIIIVTLYSLVFSIPNNNFVEFINVVGIYSFTQGKSPNKYIPRIVPPVPSITIILLDTKAENRIIRLMVHTPNNHQLNAVNASALAIPLSQKNVFPT